MTNVTLLAPCTRRGSRPLQIRSMVVLAAALAATPTSLLAEAQVQGSPDAVRIETQNSSIKEVLAALGSAFDVRYRSSADLGKQLSGTYEGSLQRVVARVLEGYDFVLRNNKGKIEITVLGTRNTAPGAAVASSAAKPGPAASGAAMPVATPSKATEQPAPTTSPAPSSPANTKVAQAQAIAPAATAAFSDPTKLAEMSTVSAPVPMPIPSSGSGPIPELMPTPSSVAPPMPSPASAPFPEPVAGAAEVPPPVPVPVAGAAEVPPPVPVPVAEAAGPDLGSASVPAPVPSAVPAPSPGAH